MLRWDDRWVLVQTSTGFLSLASPKVSDILWQGNTCVTCASLTKSLWSIKYTLWLPRQGPEWTHNRAHMGLLSCSWLVGSKCLQQVCSFLFCFVFVCFVLFCFWSSDWRVMRQSGVIGDEIFQGIAVGNLKRKATACWAVCVLTMPCTLAILLSNNFPLGTMIILL